MKKSRIIKSSSQLLIISLLIGNPLLRDTLTVFATENEPVEQSTTVREPVTFTNGSARQEIKVEVKSKHQGQITIQYVDTFGNPIKDKQTGDVVDSDNFYGSIGDSAEYDVYVHEVFGWKVSFPSFPETFVYTEQPQTYNVICDDIGTIYISYKDNLGNSLMDDDRNTEFMSQIDWNSATWLTTIPYEVKPIEISGYTMVKTEGDPEIGTIRPWDARTYHVTFVYEKIDKTSIKANNSTIYVGDIWNPEDNFEKATDSKGTSLNYEDIKVIGTVDTNKAGIYPVSYVNGSIQSDVEVTVKDNQTAVNVHDSSLYVGDTWKAEDNFDSALDKDGKKVNFSQLTVDASKVDTTTAGVYDVTYTYDEVASVAKVTVKDKQPKDSQSVFRLYNPNTGEHLYTVSSYEYDSVAKAGWRKEGIVWNAPTKGQAVYRLYNPNTGEHFYTLSSYEYNSVAKDGWRKEGIGFYSDSSKGVPIYRAFNSNTTGPGSHLYTSSSYEYNSIVKLGWHKEGIAFYGLK